MRTTAVDEYLNLSQNLTVPTAVFLQQQHHHQQQDLDNPLQSTHYALARTGSPKERNTQSARIRRVPTYCRVAMDQRSSARGWERRAREFTHVVGGIMLKLSLQRRNFMRVRVMIAKRRSSLLQFGNPAGCGGYIHHPLTHHPMPYHAVNVRSAMLALLARAVRSPTRSLTTTPSPHPTTGNEYSQGRTERFRTQGKRKLSNALD